MSENLIVSKSFKFFYLEGSHYDVGCQIAEKIKHDSSATKFYTAGQLNAEKYGFRCFAELLEYYENFFPGFTDEIKGFADTLDISPENVIIFGFPESFGNNCSHYVVLPSITSNNHILAARNYEWNHNEEDLILTITNVKGKTKYIGFVLLLFGRYEGLNNYGLCITSSGGWACRIENYMQGIPFSLALRAVLENTRNTSEAVDFLQNIPTQTTNNYLISDKKGNVALLECLNSEYSIKEIDLNSEKQFLISTNHYNMSDKIQYNKHVGSYFLSNSQTRYQTINKFLEQNKKKISIETIKEILSKEMPDGICAYDYKGYFGTIWSMIFDITTGYIEVTYGPPSHNSWVKYNLKTFYEDGEYEAKFPEKKLPRFSF
jgi:predicted choloylglycine hydrolase